MAQSVCPAPPGGPPPENTNFPPQMLQVDTDPDPDP